VDTGIVRYADLGEGKVTENVKRSMRLCVFRAKRAVMRARSRREASKVTTIVLALLTESDAS